MRQRSGGGGHGLAVVDVGFTQSRVEDPHDRRVKLISLTATGLELIGRRMDDNRRALRAFIDRLPEADALRLADALEPILAGDALPPTKKESHDH